MALRISMLLGHRLVKFLLVCYVGLAILSVSQTAMLELRIPNLTNDWMLQFPFASSFNSTESERNDVALKSRQTLALLYPPGMIGGSRNQVIRFVALVAYAQKQNITQLLLPSILWSTQYEASGLFYPVPMEMLFDVDHWNSFHPFLPLLIPSIRNSDCWGTTVNNSKNPYYYSLLQTSRLKSATNATTIFIPPLAKHVLENVPFLTPVLNMSWAATLGQLTIKPRQLDLLPDVANCSHPLVYGGGKGAGRLWNDYLVLPKYQPGSSTANTQAANATTKLITAISQALHPAPQWRTLAQQCIQQQSHSRQNYLALHARVEVDMMIHKCGRDMEKNLSNIFNMVDHFVSRYKETSLRGIFLAVSRTGMLEPTKDAKVQQTADSNYQTLVRRSVSNTDQRSQMTRPHPQRATVFECGEVWIHRWDQQLKQGVPSKSYGSILPSILNFYIATQAKVFIGVAKSSWSTDVWTTRYYQGKGATNYQYTPDGILPLSNGGLPPAHKNC